MKLDEWIFLRARAFDTINNRLEDAVKEYTAKEMKLFKINSCQDEEIANALQESFFGHMKDEIEVSACIYGSAGKWTSNNAEDTGSAKSVRIISK